MAASSVAAIMAVGVNSDGRREVLGIQIGTSEAEPIWTEFLRRLTRRGLRGVKLVISDAHEGIKAAVTKVLCATWQRCRVHFMCWLIPARGRRVAGAFAQEAAEAASTQWRVVADQIRPKVPKLAAIMDEAETDVLAHMTSPREQRVQLHSTNPIERVNREIKRRTEVVGIFPNDDAIIRLVGAILLEQNNEWAGQRARYMTLEPVASLSDDPLVSLPAPAHAGKASRHSLSYTTLWGTIQARPLEAFRRQLKDESVRRLVRFHASSDITFSSGRGPRSEWGVNWLP